MLSKDKIFILEQYFSPQAKYMYIQPNDQTQGIVNNHIHLQITHLHLHIHTWYNMYTCTCVHYKYIAYTINNQINKCYMIH